MTRPKKLRCAFCRRRWTTHMAFLSFLKELPICQPCEAPLIAAARAEVRPSNS